MTYLELPLAQGRTMGLDWQIILSEFQNCCQNMIFANVFTMFMPLSYLDINIGIC